MAESVIRQDVVEISFKTDLSGLTAATKGLDDLKKSVLGIKTDDSLKKLADSTKGVKTGVDSVTSSIAKMGDTAGINNIKNGLSSIKDGAKNGAKFLGEMGKTSFSLLKSSMDGVTNATTKIATAAKDKALSALKTLGSAGASVLGKLGDAAKGVASTIASVFDKAVKGIAVAATAVTTAIGTISVKAISAYADQEQLIGGVETLFKDSAGELVNYANDAYKTAGMSANDYMDNVTGFSASLISSLGGDTKKAVETANQAIVDMSDNSNKMGTDIGMIQNAYQGFAKQNYTINLMSAA